MPNLVVIFGPPASGKAAVGHELSELIGNQSSLRLVAVGEAPKELAEYALAPPTVEAVD